MKPLWAIVFLLLCLNTTTAFTADWGPWEVKKAVDVRQETTTSVLQTAVQLFQKYISPVDGQRCAMYPTCSAYSLQALRQHGPLLGVFLTVDRLYHEGDPIEQQHPINKWGYIRFYDPLENNDFWLND
ncbi:putative membrane protein insertion efficiency factor [Desulfuromusa kysingii]|uniref:Putative membrane protein insertion efficiency factor n=1 Tax=Desulfuromusa kysingii TaxID=37625 RepID=A0A1H4C3W2_9BACT|nr:membrane protein insertion efficiency factor YidD [Desulfuromusa kysingii]SEA55135.1 putative membrane protein insertion efficiency factor [Desulfuromusa kysingii]